MSPGVSVVICCHNSAKRLPETLRHLAAQEVPPEISWEIIVIDNASTDGTAETARRCWPSNAPAPLRVVAEPEAGLHRARVRGIQEVRHEIMSFVDDDNWIAPDWVERVAGIFARHPRVGACGGRTDPVTEIDPPAWFHQIKGCYATGSQHAQSGDITDSPGTLLWGAGLNLRSEAVRGLLQAGFTFMMSGRKGGQLSAGEDTELCFALRASGWRFWYDESLVVKHFIPGERLSWDYAQRLMAGMGRAAVMIDLYLFALQGPPFEKYPSWKKTWGFQFLKTVRQGMAVILAHPHDSLFLPENSLATLKFKKLTAQSVALWGMRTQYDEMKRRVSALRNLDKTAG
jgi:glycosyltransferase involved in cell wall biosynthesis